MARDKLGHFIKEAPVNQNHLNIARARAGNYRQNLVERAEIGRREAEKPDFQVNQLGSVGEIARQQAATRQQAYEEAVNELQRFDNLSDAELVRMFVPEANPPAETVNLVDTLARGARTAEHTVTHVGGIPV